MSEEAEVNLKVRRASQMLMLQRHRMPGVKGWELKRALGKEYVRIVEVLNSHLDKLDLQVKVVYEEGEEPKEPTPEQLDRARFFILMKNPPNTPDVVASGWRIDDVAILAAAIAYIISRHGKAPRKDVEQLLKAKFPKWRVEIGLDRYIRRGYVGQDGDETLTLGWRTRAEVDQKTLMKLLLSSPGSSAEPSGVEVQVK